ncbi:MAG: hypothetical protein KKE20_02235 [Nanoarchaeota archaeon]|nr:hypothetical protein [Nanoarchaeota archaeon]
MKTAIVLLLVISTVFLVSACGADSGSKGIEQPQQDTVTETQTIQDIDSSLISEEDDVEIGEMI